MTENKKNPVAFGILLRFFWDSFGILLRFFRESFAFRFSLFAIGVPIPRRNLNDISSFDRSRKRHFIRVFQLSADRDSFRDAGYLDVGCCL